MDTAIIGLIGVVVGAAISTGANYLLAVRKEATEKRNWRRDHCLEAYSDFLRACTGINFEANALYFAECGTKEHAKHGVIVLEKVDELYRVTDRALLFSPREMHKDLSDLALYCGKEIAAKSAKCPKVSDTKWKNICGEAYAQLYARVANAARKRTWDS